jgi:hypothetical protein
MTPLSPEKASDGGYGGGRNLLSERQETMGSLFPGDPSPPGTTPSRSDRRPLTAIRRSRPGQSNGDCQHYQLVMKGRLGE